MVCSINAAVSWEGMGSHTLMIGMDVVLYVVPFLTCQYNDRPYFFHFSMRMCGYFLHSITLMVASSLGKLLFSIQMGLNFCISVQKCIRSLHFIINMDPNILI